MIRPANSKDQKIKYRDKSLQKAQYDHYLNRDTWFNSSVDNDQAGYEFEGVLFCIKKRIMGLNNFCTNWY